MPFPIVIRSDLSFSALAQLRNDGFSICKSPHVGNVYPNNLVAARMGMRMIFYDRTIGRRDTNFHPHTVICGGNAEVVASEHMLTTHAVVSHPSSHDRFTLGRRVVDCHMEAMQQAMPNADCLVYTEYLRQNADIVLRVLEAVTNARPQIWTHHVTHDGERQELCRLFGGWKDVVMFGVFGFHSDHSGALLPNVLNVLLAGIIESIQSDHRLVYHLSGPDMVKYVGGMQTQLHLLYDHVRSMACLPLPKTLMFQLVPVAGVKLATDTRYTEEVNELVDAWLALLRGTRLRSEIMRHTSDEKADAKRCKEEKTHEMRRLQEAARRADCVFYDIAEANTFTQHDMCSGQGLYVHPWAMETPISQIDHMMDVCTKLRDRRK